MEFNYEKHRRLWLLLSENIAEATKENYAGKGFYSGYSAMEKLKHKLLQQYFDEDDRQIRNLCFACNTAVREEQERDLHESDSTNCEYCPLRWPSNRYCDDKHSLYIHLIDCLENNDESAAAKVCIAIANVKPYTDEEYEKKIPQSNLSWNLLFN